MINNKHILIIDLALIVGTLVLIAYFVGYAQPLIISPQDEFVTRNSSVLFSFEKENVILIDDNLEFSSPDKIFVEENLIINLKPGVYYWKVEGFLESEVRELTIQSEVNLKIKKSDKNDSYEVTNAGNTNLDVEIYDKGVLVGEIVLDTDETKEISGTKFIGRENDTAE